MKIRTVCEILGDVARYADTTVAVVGRMEPSVGLTDHYEFLSQDRCEHPVITHGHVWPDKIQVWTDWEAGMPKPPGEKPKLERLAVSAKLLMVRKTTTLGSHQEPQFQVDGHSIAYTHFAAVPNEWAVVYGRIVSEPSLNDDCGLQGCGGDDVPLIIVAEPYNVYRLWEDATAVSEGR